MATYPSLSIHPSSRRVIRDGRRLTIADSGKSYISNLYSQDRSDFDIVHVALSTTDLGTLTTFYGTNANIVFDFYWPQDATTYTSLRFGPNALQITPNQDIPMRHDVRVTMIGGTT